MADAHETPCRYCGGELLPVGGGMFQCDGCGRAVAGEFL